jgi:hypothetical protein
MATLDHIELPIAIVRHINGVYIEFNGYNLLFEPHDLVALSQCCFYVLSARHMGEELGALKKCLNLAESCTVKVSGGRLCGCCKEIL